MSAITNHAQMHKMKGRYSARLLMKVRRTAYEVNKVVDKVVVIGWSLSASRQER